MSTVLYFIGDHYDVLWTSGVGILGTGLALLTVGLVRQWRTPLAK